MKQREVECLTLRPSPLTKQQFHDLVRARGHITQNEAFKDIIARLHAAMKRKLDAEGVELLKAGKLDHAAWTAQHERYQRRSKAIAPKDRSDA